MNRTPAPKAYQNRALPLPERCRLYAAATIGADYVERVTADLIDVFSEGIPEGQAGAYYRRAFADIMG